jgi:hypothetical protein
MADKNSLIQFVAQKLGPEKLQQMVDQISQELGQDSDVTPEVIDQMINLFGQVAENPESYQSVVQEAINVGVLDQGDFPEEFDPIFIGILLLALQGLKQQGVGSQAFAKGGLAQAAQKIQSQGRNSDTILAHISPHEALFLKRLGGSGTINPQTGLMEFGLGLKKAFKKVAKAVVSVAKVVAPIVVTATLGPVAGAATGAAIGATGGGGLKGAILGGLSASLAPGGALGGGIPGLDLAGSVGKTVLDSGVGSMLNNIIGPQTLGAGLLGGAASAAAGKGFLQGALTTGGMAAMTPTINSLTNSLTSPGGLFSSQAGGTGVNLGSSQVGGPGVNLGSTQVGGPGVNLSSTGAAPTGLTQTSGNLLSSSGVADAANYGLPSFDLAPTTVTGPGIVLPGFDSGAAVKDAAANWNMDVSNIAAANAGNIVAPAASTGILGSGITGSQALLGLTALNALGGVTPTQAQQTIANSSLTEQQKADMARNLTNYSASWNATVLPKPGTPEYADMMNKISRGIGINFVNPTITAMKRGGKANAPQGALSTVARLASGTGSGRDDTINAKLSDGEYVLDAETVALLGNGSTKAGAAVLNQMREQLRKQKGKALAKGKFSPNAKSPLAYMKGGLK